MEPFDLLTTDCWSKILLDLEPHSLLWLSCTNQLLFSIVEDHFKRQCNANGWRMTNNFPNWKIIFFTNYVTPVPQITLVTNNRIHVFITTYSGVMAETILSYLPQVLLRVKYHQQEECTGIEWGSHFYPMIMHRNMEKLSKIIRTIEPHVTTEPPENETTTGNLIDFPFFRDVTREKATQILQENTSEAFLVRHSSIQGAYVVVYRYRNQIKQCTIRKFTEKTFMTLVPDSKLGDFFLFRKIKNFCNWLKKEFNIVPIGYPGSLCKSMTTL